MVGPGIWWPPLDDGGYVAPSLQCARRDPKGSGSRLQEEPIKVGRSRNHGEYQIEMVE